MSALPEFAWILLYRLHDFLCYKLSNYRRCLLLWLCRKYRQLISGFFELLYHLSIKRPSEWTMSAPSSSSHTIDVCFGLPCSIQPSMQGFSVLSQIYFEKSYVLFPASLQQTIRRISGFIFKSALLYLRDWGNHQNLLSRSLWLLLVAVFCAKTAIKSCNVFSNGLLIKIKKVVSNVCLIQSAHWDIYVFCSHHLKRIYRQHMFAFALP